MRQLYVGAYNAAQSLRVPCTAHQGSTLRKTCLFWPAAATAPCQLRVADLNHHCQLPADPLCSKPCLWNKHSWSMRGADDDAVWPGECRSTAGRWCPAIAPRTTDCPAFVLFASGVSRLVADTCDSMIGPAYRNGAGCMPGFVVYTLEVLTTAHQRAFARTPVSARRLK